MKPDWLDTAEYPFTSRFVELNGHKMHYIDEGNGPVILFIHGTPSWSFDFRKLIKELSKNYRCIAMDHIGFGLSDKPSIYDYSTQKHAESLELFIKNLDLSTFTMVAHDFGGPIGINYALKYPEQISGLIILNSWLWRTESDPVFRKMRKMLKSPLLPFLYLYLNFSAKFLLPGSMTNKPGKNTLRHYIRPFGSKAERYGPLAFARSLLNDQPWFEALWNQLSKISNKQALFVWGMNDKFIGGHYLEKFQSAFKNSSSLELKCGHFPQEECSDKVISGILNFLNNNIK